MNKFIKDPDSILDYTIDWSDWLGSDTIISSNWTVPTGITQGSVSNTDTATTIWLSGGVVGKTYSVVNRIETAGGRTDDRTITIVIREK